jgi:hypothetical protein
MALAVPAFALSAAASSLPAQPAPTSNPCLSVSVAPHVVSVGGNVIARTGSGTGGCTHSQVEWNWFVNGEKSTTCGTSSTSCEIKATRPTNGYRPICAVGTGASAGIQACDYVAVEASGTYTVSGRLTGSSTLIRQLAKSTPSLANVANAKVEAIDAEGEPTIVRTAADGSYSLSLSRGRYTITVEPDAGTGYQAATTPDSRTVNVGGEVPNVNFALGRILHLEGELTWHGSARRHRLGLRMVFKEHGRPVGSANNVVCSVILCVGRTFISGIDGNPWLRVEWPSTAGADRGTGIVTSERLLPGEHNGANAPSEENQYEGTIVVHSKLQFGYVLHRPFPITIALI